MMTLTEQREALEEVRAEIARINQAAGKTVFNPAATALLDETIEDIKASEMMYG